MNTSKKLLIVIIVLTLGAPCNQVYGQVPNGINFQAMARQADGRPIANKQVSVRISIANQSASGNKEYVEQHFPTTNALGLFDLIIGKGNLVSGSFASITWANGNKWIQVELDPDGANNFILMGSQQMMSVPYSIYADIAGNVINYKSGDGINIVGDEISNTGDNDNDSTNELVHSLELDNDNILRLQDAGGIKEIDLNKFDNKPLGLGDVLTIGTDAANKRISNLANPESDLDAATKFYVDNLDIKDDDADPTNEIQDLELTSNMLKVTGNESATEIDLSPYLDNTDNQSLSLAGSAISISGGNTIDLNSINTDNQTLNLLQNELIISGGNAVDLSVYLDNTDNQTINLTGTVIGITGGNNIDIGTINTDNQELNILSNQLSISGGNNVDLSAYLDNTDNQVLSIASNQLSISGGNFVNLSAYLDNTDNQELSLISNQLSISGGNMVNLSAYLDNTDDQNLSLTATGTNRTINIENGTGVTFSVADNDNSSTNEAQTLSKSGSQISLTAVGITGGGTIILNDDDPLNEIQDLQLTSNILSITNKSNPTNINLTPYLDNTDNQILNISSDNLNITGGNSVSLVPYRQNLNTAVSGTSRTITISGGASTTFSIADNDNDPSNELQNLTQVLSRGNSAGFISILNLGYSTDPNAAATVGYVDQKFSGMTPSAQMSVNSGDELSTSTTATNNHYAFKVSTAFSGVGINSLVSLTRNTSGFDEANSINQNRFVAAENGIYQFTINASSSDAGATLKVSINGNNMSNIMKVNAGLFQETLMFKLNTNDYLEIRIDQGTAATLTGSFHGFKL